MREIKYIADLSLSDLPSILVEQLNGLNWDLIEPNKRLNEISYCITEIYFRLERETNSDVRKELFKELRILKEFQNMKVTCPYVYVLVTNDILELPVIVADSIKELASKLGISIWSCFKHESRDSSIFGQYKIRKVDICEPQDKFNYLEYKKFCLDNKISQSDFKSLSRFKDYCYCG